MQQNTLKFMQPKYIELEDFLMYNIRQYACELKLNGIRVLLAKKGSQISLFMRSGEDIANKADLSAFMAISHDFALDCELVAENQDIDLLQSAIRGGKQANTAICVFDALEYDGQDFTKHPYKERRTFLERFASQHNFMIVPMKVFDNFLDFENKYYEITKKYEGVVLKHIDSAYIGDYSKGWFKIKKSETMDMVVKGKSKRDEIYSYLLEKDGIKVGVGSYNDYKIGSVLEVKYQVKTKNSLKFASIIRERIDKNA